MAKPVKPLELHLQRGAKLSVTWDGDFEEFVAVLTDAEGREVGDGNGETVEDALANCEVNADEHERWTTA